MIGGRHNITAPGEPSRSRRPRARALLWGDLYPAVVASLPLAAEVPLAKPA